MSNKIKAKVYLNAKKYGYSFINSVLQQAAAEGKNRARKLVRKDSTALVNSIEIYGRAGASDYRYSAGTEYAAAQEWGLAAFGKPNYGFTPYMRPSAIWAVTSKNLKKYITRAAEVAEKIAGIRGGK